MSAEDYVAALKHDETGRLVGKKAAGRLLDGQAHDGYPEVTR